MAARSRSLCRLYCTALHCTALHFTALHCTALHCTALHRTALHCTATSVSAVLSKYADCRSLTICLSDQLNCQQIVNVYGYSALHAAAYSCTALHPRKLRIKYSLRSQLVTGKVGANIVYGLLHSLCDLRQSTRFQ
jgi:hypothetical protein